MIFTETPLKGAFVIDLEPHRDARGFFARSYCRRQFEAHGLNPAIAQCNFSFNQTRGTVRGMHFQKAPARETKLVRCVRGGIHDVIIDLRPESPTYCQPFTIKLNAETYRALFIPELFAHGFQSLLDDTLVEYQMGDYYAPENGSGFRHDDPAFAIQWPLAVSSISEQDMTWPEFIR
ncbi:MAG: dTDP-4-dehydrorhamnose 3,5-epimerase family protein [Chthoniobacterales bacterium]